MGRITCKVWVTRSEDIYGKARGDDGEWIGGVAGTREYDTTEDTQVHYCDRCGAWEPEYIFPRNPYRHSDGLPRGCVALLGFGLSYPVVYLLLRFAVTPLMVVIDNALGGTAWQTMRFCFTSAGLVLPFAVAYASLRWFDSGKNDQANAASVWDNAHPAVFRCNRCGHRWPMSDEYGFADRNPRGYTCDDALRAGVISRLAR